MAGVALAVMCLIGVAIYSLSQLKETVWTSSLQELSVQAVESRALPDFQFKDGDQTLKPADFHGHWTLLSFWAHWCGPCLEEMPALNQLGEQWQSTALQVLTVNVDDPTSESFESARQFLTDNEITLPTFYDRQKVLKNAFGVEELPQHFLINPQGQVVWRAVGAFKWNDPKARDQLVLVMGDEAFSDGDGIDGFEDTTDGPPPSPTEPQGSSPKSAPQSVGGTGE